MYPPKSYMYTYTIESRLDALIWHFSPGCIACAVGQKARIHIYPHNAFVIEPLLSQRRLYSGRKTRKSKLFIGRRQATRIPLLSLRVILRFPVVSSDVHSRKESRWKGVSYLWNVAYLQVLEIRLRIRESICKGIHGCLVRSINGMICDCRSRKYDYAAMRKLLGRINGNEKGLGIAII